MKAVFSPYRPDFFFSHAAENSCPELARPFLLPSFITSFVYRSGAGAVPAGGAPGADGAALRGRVGKNPGLKKKTSPVVFWVSLGGFFGVGFYCQPCYEAIRFYKRAVLLVPDIEYRAFQYTAGAAADR
jgi:hypothetical protein